MWVAPYGLAARRKVIALFLLASPFVLRAAQGTGDGFQPASPLREVSAIREQQPVTPEQFGCVQDFSDLNDDSGCIQAMFDSGATDMYLTRRYRIRRSLTLSGTNRRLHASFMWQSGFSVESDDFNLLVIKGPGPLLIEDMTLASWRQSGTHLFYAIDEQASAPVMYLQLRRLKIFGWDNAIHSVGTYADFSDLFITNSEGGAGITYDTTSEVKTFRNSTIVGGRYGILVRGGSAFDFNTLELMGSEYAIAVITHDNIPVNSVKMVDVWADSTRTAGLLLDSEVGATHRVSAEASWFCGSKGSGIIVRGWVQGLWINNSEICQNAKDGLRVEATPSAGSINGMMLNANRISGNGAAGIAIRAAVSNFTITANIIGPAADFGGNSIGISLDNPLIDNFLIANNQLSGNKLPIVSVANGSHQLWANNLSAPPFGK